MGKDYMKFDRVFSPDLGVLKTDTFSSMYPLVNHFIFTEMNTQESRDGEVREMLDIKTHVTNPYRRCVGGYERNINIFFLLAEAMWIALGKKDVHFLTLFNKKMAEYSDDGIVFHAPYGFRLRHWGIHAEDRSFEPTTGASRGYDQVVEAIRVLSENPNSRQVVMEIWNPEFDLGFKTKDIPCNDIVMFKIRNGKLVTTIGNRSNDLHLGLPTNLFQFSFLTELMASCLGIELGTQTHNSQSLHIYSWNKSAEVMDKIFQAKERGLDVVGDMYDDCSAVERKMDFNFYHDIPVNRFREIECNLNAIIGNLTKVAEGGTESAEEIAQLATFSTWLHASYQLLKVFLNYKQRMGTAVKDIEKDAARLTAISEIEVIEHEVCGADARWDVTMLAKNWFHARLSNKSNHEFLGKL